MVHLLAVVALAHKLAGVAARSGHPLRRAAAPSAAAAGSSASLWAPKALKPRFQMQSSYADIEPCKQKLNEA